MININVYDIANKAWYTQPTSGGPGQLTRGCAVVAPAQDLSSFNIYYYGGYNGLDETKGFSDDVWILSLPSFMWMKVASGNAVHGRAGHKCVMPYPDQMIVVGGYTNSSGTSPVCLDGNVVQAFNLSSGTWMNRYDPGKWSEYGVPSMINVMIGGDASGGATMLEPSATGFASSEIAAIFKTAYPTSKIATYYPYGTASTNPDYSRGRAGVPPYLGPVLGVVLGLLFVGSLVFGWCLYRRRKMQRKNGGMSEAGTEDANGARIATWLRQQQADGKAPTTTTTTTEETTPMSPDVEQAPVAHAPIVPFEMADTQVHSFELMGEHSFFRPYSLSEKPDTGERGFANQAWASRHVSPGRALGYGSYSCADHRKALALRTRRRHQHALQPVVLLGRHTGGQLQPGEPEHGRPADGAGEAAAPAPAGACAIDRPTGLAPAGHQHDAAAGPAAFAEPGTGGGWARPVGRLGHQRTRALTPPPGRRRHQRRRPASGAGAGVHGKRVQSRAQVGGGGRGGWARPCFPEEVAGEQDVDEQSAEEECLPREHGGHGRAGRGSR